jgi:hypothetical protein
MLQIARCAIAQDWALWTTVEDATHALAMDTDEGRLVWIGTDHSTAAAYGRVHGSARVASIGKVER